MWTVSVHNFRVPFVNWSSILSRLSTNKMTQLTGRCKLLWFITETKILNALFTATFVLKGKLVEKLQLCHVGEYKKWFKLYSHFLIKVLLALLAELCWNCKEILFATGEFLISQSERMQTFGTLHDLLCLSSSHLFAVVKL